MDSDAVMKRAQALVAADSLFSGAGEAPPADAGGQKYAELGVTGLRTFSGVVDEEFLNELKGDRGRKIFREMSENDATVGAVLLAVMLLVRAAKFFAEPADESEQAKGEADFAESLFNDMSHTWEDTLSEILSMLTYGWAFLEVVIKQRVGPEEKAPEKRSAYDDGRIGIRKLSIRSQDTLDRWAMQSDGGVSGMWQVDPNGRGRLYIPIERALLFRTTSRRNSPEGVSVLRTAYRSWFFLKRVQEFEAVGIERELAGMPVARIPGKYLATDASVDEKALLAAVKQIVRDVKFNSQGGIVLPSDMWKDKDGGAIAGAYQVTLELLSSGGTRAIDTSVVKNDYMRAIARAVLADFVMLGQDKGAYNLGESKTSLFLKAIEAFLDQVLAPINRFLLPRIWELNSLPRETMPAMKFGRITPADLAKLGAFLRDMSGAGAQLFPDDDLEGYLRDEADLPAKSQEAVKAQEDQAALDREAQAASIDAQRATAEAKANGGAAAGGGNGAAKPGEKKPPFGKAFDPNQERDDHGRWTDGEDHGEPLADKRTIENLKGQKVSAPRTFYRGDKPGDERRISTGDEGWDAHLFVADNAEAASFYGHQITRVDAKPEARILYEGTKEFRALAKGIKPGNLLETSSEVVKRAKAAGDYDAVWFKRQGDVGTVILNRDKFIIRGPTKVRIGKAFDPSQPRAEDGRWTDGDGHPSLEDVEREFEGAASAFAARPDAAARAELNRLGELMAQPKYAVDRARRELAATIARADATVEEIQARRFAVAMDSAVAGVKSAPWVRLPASVYDTKLTPTARLAAAAAAVASSGIDASTVEPELSILRREAGVVEKSFDPSQPRAEDGEWTSGGGSGAAPAKGSPEAFKRLLAETKERSARADEILDDVLAAPKNSAVLERDGRRMLISRSLSPGFDLRVTDFNDEGKPSGHREYTLEDLKGVKSEIFTALTAGYGVKVIKEFDPNQPRDYHGRWSETGAGSGGGSSQRIHTGTADALAAKSRQWTSEAQPRTLDEMLRDAPANQAELAKLGEAVASANGVEFKNPGIKKNRERILEKMAQKNRGAHEITDIARAAFIVERADQADAVVKALAARWEVIDEGWRRTEGGYIDRPVKIRFDDGMIGEIQVLERNMANAKGGGHHLYEEARSLPDGHVRKRHLVESMQRLYGGALVGAHPSLRVAFSNA